MTQPTESASFSTSPPASGPSSAPSSAPASSTSSSSAPAASHATAGALKPWAGRFNEPTDAFVEAFTASVDFDRRLYAYDIQGSIAHATMLARQGILTDAEREAIVSGLERVRARIEAGDFTWSIPLEDVHMNVETALTADIGAAGKKLHTGRSRNDQVATDVRLWLRAEIETIDLAIARLQTALLDLAEREVDTILPGFTHLQVAQPVSFGHHLLAWFEMLARDRERLADCRRRGHVIPPGGGAPAGGARPLHRHPPAAPPGVPPPGPGPPIPSPAT